MGNKEEKYGTKVEFESDGLLKGMLTIPDADDNSPLPAIVFIHGSGPLDKDENVKKLKLNVFNRLAEWLADQDIASLRYDKRGTGERSGSYHRKGVWDLISDSVTAVSFLKAPPKIDSSKVFILGHSEGGMIAPEIAS
ncbi:alpha/beta hydrolase family protein [Alteribacillus sp. JSM 102045]|uniref:alpha/beta hydrolase family protein n=1 Tax=Alteribacillus sp. JSM 102045 TaxID=1562101 RepID=UPI0035C06DDC